MSQLSIFDLIMEHHIHDFYLSGSSERWCKGILITAYKFECIRCKIKSVNGGYLPRSDDKILYKTYKEYFTEQRRKYEM